MLAPSKVKKLAGETGEFNVRSSPGQRFYREHKKGTDLGDHYNSLVGRDEKAAYRKACLVCVRERHYIATRPTSNGTLTSTIENRFTDLTWFFTAFLPPEVAHIAKHWQNLVQIERKWTV